MNVGRFVSFVLLLLVCPALAPGDELCFVPTVAVKEESNSNILLATDGGDVRSDYITTLSPGFQLTDRTERLDSLLSLRLDQLHYTRNKDLNATNQIYSGSIRYAATELLDLSVDASYLKVFNPSLWTGWVYNSGPPPGTVIPVIIVPPPPPPGDPGGGSGGVGGGSNTSTFQNPALPLIAAPVTRIASSMSADYRLTEKTSLMAGYQFGQSYYERPKYHDTSHDANAGIAVDLSAYLPRTQGRLNTGYSQYILPNSRTINVMGTIGFSHNLSEMWKIYIDGGIRLTESEIWANVPVPPSQTPPSAYLVVDEHLKDWGRVGHLSLNYRDEYMGAGLLYTYDFTMASLAQGYQAPAERNALSLTIRYQVTKELSASLGASYSTYRHPVNIAADTFKQDSVSMSPRLRYDLSRDLALEASYERSRFNYKALGTDANREVFFIRLTARFPFCSSCQYKY
jgi:predicted porin